MKITTAIRADQEVQVNGAKIRALRKAHPDLTQVELAAASGVSRSYIAEIERGSKQPRYLYATAIAKGLGVELEDILMKGSKRP